VAQAASTPKARIQFINVRTSQYRFQTTARNVIKHIKNSLKKFSKKQIYISTGRYPERQESSSVLQVSGQSEAEQRGG